MKKVFFILLLAIFTGCSNVKTYKASDEDRALCKENMDTIINHLADGWVVVDSFFNTDKYYSVTHKDGSREDFYHWILLSRVSDGKDTLTIMTTPLSSEEWSGEITSLHFLSSKDIVGIKRRNLAIKAACKDTCFVLSVDDSKIMRAKFLKEKPKEPERPLEDYGLKESDL